MPIDFVLVSPGRSGSTWLRSLLNSHPSVYCAEELFNVLNVNEGSFTGSDLPAISYLERYRATYPGRVFGWKFLFDQHFQQPEVVTYLRQHSTKVVWLDRVNTAAMYVSLKLSAREQNWERPYGGAGITIDRAEFLRYCKVLASWRQKISALYADNPVFHLNYESLLSRLLPVCDDLLRFLGVPSRPLVSPLIRQNQCGLRASIINRSDVAGFIIKM